MFNEKKVKALADLATLESFLKDIHDDINLSIDKSLIRSIPDMRRKLSNHIVSELIELFKESDKSNS